MSLEDRRTRLPKGKRKQIRRLLSLGKVEEADLIKSEEYEKKDWNIRVDTHLKENGFDGISSLGENGAEVINQWVTIRTRYKSRFYSKETFDTEKNEFSEKYNEVLDADSVISAITFVTAETKRS